jgi:AmmeMemoRadiSam system protein B
LFSGVSIYNGAAYRTPLGTVKVNEEIRDTISKQDKSIMISESGHRDEHAVEVQLPFLQHVLKDFKFVPIVIGEQSAENCIRLGEMLHEVLQNHKVVVIASSDLSHYHTQKEAVRLDEIVADDVKEMDEKKLLSDLSSHRTEACGGGPIAATISFAKKHGANKSTILHQCTSAETSGDMNHVVGYLSAALYKQMPS